MSLYRSLDQESVSCITLALLIALPGPLYRKVHYNLCHNKGKATADYGAYLQYPLSRDEHVAVARYLSGIRKQLQDVSDLFTTRYGTNSSIAEIAVKTLVSSTLLEHELMLLEEDTELRPASLLEEEEELSTAY